MSLFSNLLQPSPPKPNITISGTGFDSPSKHTRSQSQTLDQAAYAAPFRAAFSQECDVLSATTPRKAVSAAASLSTSFVTPQKPSSLVLDTPIKSRSVQSLSFDSPSRNTRSQRKDSEASTAGLYDKVEGTPKQSLNSAKLGSSSAIQNLNFDSPSKHGKHRRSQTELHTRGMPPVIGVKALQFNSPRRIKPAAVASAEVQYSEAFTRKEIVRSISFGSQPSSSFAARFTASSKAEIAAASSTVKTPVKSIITHDRLQDKNTESSPEISGFKTPQKHSPCQSRIARNCLTSPQRLQLRQQPTGMPGFESPSKFTRSQTQAVASLFGPGVTYQGHMAMSDNKSTSLVLQHDQPNQEGTTLQNKARSPAAESVTTSPSHEAGTSVLCLDKELNSPTESDNKCLVVKSTPKKPVLALVRVDQTPPSGKRTNQTGHKHTPPTKSPLDTWPRKKPRAETVIPGVLCGGTKDCQSGRESRAQRKRQADRCNISNQTESQTELSATDRIGSTLPVTMGTPRTHRKRKETSDGNAGDIATDLCETPVKRRKTLSSPVSGSSSTRMSDARSQVSALDSRKDYFDSDELFAVAEQCHQEGSVAETSPTRTGMRRQSKEKAARNRGKSPLQHSSDTNNSNLPVPRLAGAGSREKLQLPRSQTGLLTSPSRYSLRSASSLFLSENDENSYDFPPDMFLDAASNNTTADNKDGTVESDNATSRAFSDILANDSDMLSKGQGPSSALTSPTASRKAPRTPKESPGSRTICQRQLGGVDLKTFSPRLAQSSIRQLVSSPILESGSNSSKTYGKHAETDNGILPAQRTTHAPKKSRRSLY